MTNKPFKLSDAGLSVLALATAREDRLVPPPTLPIAAARQVVRSLLNAGMLEEVTAPADEPAFNWREREDGGRLALRATELGMQAIRTAEGQGADILAGDASEVTIETEALAEAADDSSGHPASTSDTAASAYADQTPKRHVMEQIAAIVAAGTRRPKLRSAAEATVAAWDAALASGEAAPTGLHDAIGTLRGILVRGTGISSGAPRDRREGTKQSKVLEMLRRPEGATVTQIAEAMSWAPHTVRGFFAGLKKRHGIAVIPSERVRQVGSEGAKGSHTIYRIGEAN